MIAENSTFISSNIYMTYLSTVNLAECKPVNYLWPQLVEKIGLEKAQKAARQALDLQRMNGSHKTMPVLLFETCGLALVNVDLVQKNTGFSCHGERLILILSTKDNLVQLLPQI